MSRTLLLLATSLTVAASALAKDAVSAAVTPQSGPTPLVSVNGNPYSSGTFAVGTIQLFYTVNAYQFTAGDFATFQLNLQDLQINTNPPSPSYPVTLNLAQTGSANLTLTPVPAAFSVTGVGWSDSSTVTISIPASVPSDLALNVDGTDLVGNLQLTTSPSGSKLDTVTTVQIHILLVHPTSCLRMYNFMNSQDQATRVTNLIIKTQVGGPNAGKVNGTTPAQLSDNILVVNTCGATQSFDLKAALNAGFAVQSSGNPIKVYTTAGSVEPDSFSFALFSGEINKGTNLCIASLTVPGNMTLLAAIHTDIIRFSVVPSTPTLEFTAMAYGAGTSCSGPLNSMVTPNPATLSLTYTVE